MFAVLAYLIGLFLLGWILLPIVSHEVSGWERAGLAYGVGAGAWTLGVFIISLPGASITLASGAVVYMCLAVAGGVVLYRRQGFNLRTRLPRVIDISALELLLLGLIAGLVGLAFLAAIYWPPHAFDSLAIWDLKARLMATEGTLSAQRAAAGAFYPINLPLQLTFLHLLGDQAIQVIIPVYLLSLALLFYAHLRPRIGRTRALACTLFLTATPFLIYESSIAYADVPFAFYYVGSSIYLVQYLQTRARPALVLSGILIGLAGWTRPEALLYLGINFLVFLVFARLFREGLKTSLLYLSGFALFWAPWNLYVVSANLGGMLGAAQGGVQDILLGKLNLPLLVATLDQFRLETVAIGNWGFLWLLFPLALEMGWRRLREHAPLIALIALNWLGLIYTYYSAARPDPASLDWWLYTGFDRMALHWVPLIILYLGFNLDTVDFSRPRLLDLHRKVDPYLVLLMFFSLFAVAPFAKTGYVWGAHDASRSIYSLFEFDRVIQDGILYPRWLPDVNFGYGLPYFNLTSPGAFYLAEIVHLLGFDLISAIKIVYVLAILLAGATMFGLVDRLTGSRRAAFLSGLIYIYVRYYFLDIHIGTGLGESIAWTLAPLVLWGLYEAVVQPSGVAVAAAGAAYGAMLFAHAGMTLTFTIIFALWILFWVVRALRPAVSHNARQSSLVEFARLCLVPLAALGLGIGLASIHFIPAAFEYSAVRVLSGGWGFDVASILLASAVLVVAVAGIIVVFRTNDPARGLSVPTILLGALIVLGSLPNIATQAQIQPRREPIGLAGLVEYEQNTGDLVGSTAWGRESPEWSDMADVWLAGKRVKTKVIMTDYPDDVLWVGVLPEGTGMRTDGELVVLHVAQDNLAVRFNTLYYPGWRAYLVKPKTTEIIRELSVEAVGDLGQILVRMPQGREQWLMLRLDETPPQAAGKWVSALSVLLALGLVIQGMRDRRRMARDTSTVNPSSLVLFETEKRGAR